MFRPVCLLSPHFLPRNTSWLGGYPRFVSPQAFALCRAMVDRTAIIFLPRPLPFVSSSVRNSLGRRVLNAQREWSEDASR